MQSLSSLLDASVARHGSKPAVICGDVKLTYHDVNQRARGLRQALHVLGLRGGDRCAVLLGNRVEWLEIYWAMIGLGIIAVPLNFRFTEREAAYVLQNSGAKALIYEDAYQHLMAGIAASCPDVASYICIGEAEAGSLQYERLVNERREHDVSGTSAPEDIFFLGYTSGTTGFPKGAVVRQRSLVEHLHVLGREVGNISDKDTVLLLMPIFHSNGTWFLLLMAVLGGTSVIYPSSGFDPERVLQQIESNRVTFTSVVPTMLTMIIEAFPDGCPYDLQSMRLLLCSSAPLMSRTKARTIAFFSGIDIYEGYGATETGIVTLLRPSENIANSRSVGRPVAGKELRLLDASGNDVPQGDIGELYVRGAGILLSEYWQNPTGSAEARRGDWITVGDMARADADGYIFLEDRKKDMIISGGENIYPTEIENIVSSHPAVSEVAVVGRPHHLWGETVCAVISLVPGQSITEGELIKFCRERLAGYKTPRSIDIVPALPRNASGKILRRQIREAFALRDGST